MTSTDSTSAPEVTPPPTRPTLLTVAFPYAPLGPAAVGGAEVICSQLEAALPQAGFASVVVAHADSRPAGHLYPTRIPAGIITDELRAEVEAAHQAGVDRALAENVIALVHMHGLDFARYRIPAHIPVLVTLHLPAAWYPASIWDLPSQFHFICVSEHQRHSCPAAAQHRLSVIENGVPLPEASTLRPEGRYALMLARICPEKNLHIGFDAARLAGMPAILAGEVFAYEAHLQYLEHEIKPRLTASSTSHEARATSSAVSTTTPSARFLGPVAGDEKARLLQRAACLLLPSLAPETSSLVAMEALAAGIPVVGMAVGAVPGIVEHGRTGFLIPPGPDATAELSAALRRLPELDRRQCRSTAEARFPLSRMVDAYLGLYRQLALPPRPTDLQLSTQPQPQGQAQPADIFIEELREDAALEAIAAEWTALWHVDPSATPFQHPAWLLPWWHQFGPDGQLCAIALRDRVTRRLLALLPLYTYRQRSSGGRQLLLVGAGTSDILDGVWTPDISELADLALTYALDTLGGWEQLSLDQLRRSSPLVHAAERASLPLAPGEPCSALLTATELPAKMRVNLNRYRRLAESQGTLHCRLAVTAGEALTIFDQLVTLHTLRWETRGEDGVLRDSRVLAHHREALPLLLDAGLLRLFHLTLNGETLGVLYGLADPSHASDRGLSLYLIGFDARFAALSPGSLLVHQAWLHAREGGFAKLDFLRGGESYKQLWGAHPEPTITIHHQDHEKQPNNQPRTT